MKKGRLSHTSYPITHSLTHWIERFFFVCMYVCMYACTNLNGQQIGKNAYLNHPSPQKEFQSNYDLCWLGFTILEAVIEVDGHGEGGS